MKLNKMFFVVFGAISMLSFSSCNDNDRRGENEEMRNDSLRMAEENRMNEERMERENNSVLALVQEDTVLTTFSRNLETNQLDDTFREEEGPFTVFAPSNVAYQELSQEERDNLMNAQNANENSARLYYLVVDEELTADELRQEIENADGTYTLTTMQGEEITATLEGDQVVLRDGAGNEATLTDNEIDASNGVVHVIDAVLAPTDASANAAGEGRMSQMNTGTQQNNNMNNTNNTMDTTATNSGM